MLPRRAAPQTRPSITALVLLLFTFLPELFFGYSFANNPAASLLK
jgi:hypothetical protein